MGDNIVNIILGILFLILGPAFIALYQNLKKENKAGGLTFKFQTVGIGCLIIGIGFIIRALNNIFG